MYLKAFKNIKNPEREKNLRITQFFGMAKIVKIKRHGRPNRAAVIPPESPEGDLDMSREKMTSKNQAIVKSSF